MDLLKVKRLKLRIHAREFTVFNSLAIDGKTFIKGNHGDDDEKRRFFVSDSAGYQVVTGHKSIVCYFPAWMFLFTYASV